MSKNLVVQFFVPSSKYKDPTYNQIGVNEELYKYSTTSVEQYAKNIGADYKLVTKAKINHVHPTFERFDLFLNHKWWETYEHILYLDTDVIVLDDLQENFTTKVCLSPEHFPSNIKHFGFEYGFYNAGYVF